VTSLTVRLSDSQAERLDREAQRLGVAAEDLLRAAVVDLLEGRDELFLAAARQVVEKNAELYKRLA
jgi:predicted transcriptional regulator